MKIYRNFKLPRLSFTHVFAMAFCFILLQTALQKPPRAAALSQEDVQLAVKTWVRYVTADKRPDAEIKAVEPYYSDKYVIGYIVHLEKGGFCLCGADDRALPVYLYNPHGLYKSDNPSYRTVLNEIADKNLFFRNYENLKVKINDQAKLEQIFQERADLWQRLITGSLIKPGTGSVKSLDASGNVSNTMELDFTSKWNQHTPFNDQTPSIDYNDQHLHTVVGCVATATAQIMYYWKWPDKAEGQVSTVYHRKRTSILDTWLGKPLDNDPGIPADWYWHENIEWRKEEPYDHNALLIKGWWDESIHQDALALSQDTAYKDALNSLYNDLDNYDLTYQVDFDGQLPYDWDVMKDEYSSSTEDGADEVARLCLQVGVAVGMDYGLKNSSSDLGKSSAALWQHFHYDWDIKTLLPGDLYVKDKIREEIQWLRPVEMGAADDSNPFTAAGHDMVIYGYAIDTDQFLINMGWGPGTNHVWYTLSSVPYGHYQFFNTRIAPVNVKFVGHGSLVNDGSPNDPYSSLSDALDKAPSNGTVIMHAGDSYSTSDTIQRHDPLTIRGHHVTITAE